MYRAGLAYLLAVVVVGTLSCNSSQPRQEPAQETASVSTAGRLLSEEHCSNCPDIHLGDYNLFLLKDYAGGCSVGGKVAVGGNILMNGFFVGSQLSTDNFSNALVAGGELTLSGCGFRGDAWYGHGDEDSHAYDDSVVCGHSPCTAKRGTPIDFAARFAGLRRLSSRLGARPLKGETRFENGVMYLSGLDPCLNVFEANASTLTGLWMWDFTVPSGSFVVLNIRGESPTFPTNLKFNGSLTAQRVLYNVVDATKITIQNTGFSGTLLAPFAHVTVQNGSWSGGIYALAMSCAGGFSLNNDPLGEMAGAAEETCNGEDDNCDGQVDEGFECTGSGNHDCNAWCGAPGTQTCDLATCSYGECVSSSCCRADADCGSGFYCEANTCQALKENGTTCGSTHECASKECVDGVCCDTECEGECDACNLEGRVGTCSMAPLTVQCRAPESECDVAEYCTGAGAACPVNGFQSFGAACTRDGSACTLDVCDGTGSCAHPLAPAGTACGSGQICTEAGLCVSGCWIEGAYYEPWTTNLSGGCLQCNPIVSTSSWSSKTAGTSCDDGNACTTGDVCNGAGTCGGTTLSCNNPPNSCYQSAGTCSGGTCSYTPKAAGASCDDGNACTTGDVCNDAGTCGGTTLSCNSPPNSCYQSAGTCSNGTCSYAPKSVGAPCDDSNACTTGDTCNGAGVCSGTALTCSTATSTYCSGNDVRRTVGTGTCSGGSCGSIDSLVQTCSPVDSYACSGNTVQKTTSGLCSSSGCTGSSTTNVTTCSPVDSYACNGNTVQKTTSGLCSGSGCTGTSTTNVTTCSPVDSYACNGNTVQKTTSGLCSGSGCTGTSTTNVETCGSGQVCSNGACVASGGRWTNIGLCVWTSCPTRDCHLFTYPGAPCSPLGASCSITTGSGVYQYLCL